MKTVGTAAVLFLLVCSSAGAQKVTQAWTSPYTSHESRVKSCASPGPLNKVAMDDWTCPASGPIARITWWGTLAADAQKAKKFYFAIYTQTSTTSCKPGQRVWWACVAPSASSYVATDCKQRRVYKFEARFPVPFKQVKGTKYFLQISEADEESARPGVEDFRWSAHRPRVQCPALQRNSTGVFTAPLIDECDQKPDDLAFVLWAS